MAVWKRYRAECVPHQTGCRQCGKDIPDSRATCSSACRAEFERNHFWGTAADAALRRFRAFGPAQEGKRQPWFSGPICASCGKECESLETRGWPRREAEVNHKRPLNGKRPHFGCCHHQDNLEVLCHECHCRVTKEQFRSGQIGKAKRQPSMLQELSA